MSRRAFLTSAVAGTLALGLRRGKSASDIGPITYAWTGAVTSTSARVIVRTEFPSDAVWLVISTEPDFVPSVKSEPQASSQNNGCHLSFDVAKLTPKTVYHYGFEVEADGQTEWVKVGRFQTFPEGVADFQVAFASCARTGSRSTVFRTIEKNSPNLFIHMGDFHYEDIGSASPDLRRAAYARVHASDTQAGLYRHVPIAYVWDDHDFLGNNSDGSTKTFAKKKAIEDARLTYQQCVPHYPLAFGSGNVPIAQAFSLGRVRFILTDLRSSKIAGQTMFGDAQKKWFKEEIQTAKLKHPLLVWVNTVPWIGKPNPKADFWAGFDDERRELADFFKAEQLQGKICILSGDSHMLTMDDGTHSDYATGGGMPIPVFQAASLDNGGSEKGGPYTHPRSLKGGQFGMMQIRDSGSEIRVTWKGMNLDDEIVKGIEHAFTVKG